MIVGCERCSTQFQLDEARVPAEGVRVRCSRCKHAFVVAPPGAAPPDPDAVHEVASRAAEGGGIPEVTRDPDPDPTPDFASDPQTGAELDSEAGEEEDVVWEFGDGAGDLGGHDAAAEESSEEDVALDESSDGLELATEESFDLRADDGEADSAAPATEAAEPALPAEEAAGEELGSPADWDLSKDEPFGSGFVEDLSSPAGTDRPQEEWIERRPEPAPVSDLPEIDPGTMRRQRAGSVLGWGIAIGLCAAGSTFGLAPRPVALLAAAPLAAGLELQGVEGRWVDHLSRGNLFVVTGQVRNDSASPKTLPSLELVWRDSRGRPTGRPIPLGTPEPGDLRVRPIAEPGSEPAGPALALAPGRAWSFEGLAVGLPYEADHFEIRVGRQAP